MDYIKEENLAYNLHLIKTKKFKKNCIRINFKNIVKKEEITYRNMLINVLLESSKNYPTKRLLDIRSEELYGVSVNSNTSISGNYNVISFSASFLNEKYTEECMLEETIKYFLEFIFNPNASNGAFDKDSFDKAKNILLEDLETFKDNPRRYSISRCYEEMDKDSNIALNGVGYLEDLKKIDEKNLYNYYKKVLNSDIVDIFIIGDFDRNIKDIINKYMKINTLKKTRGSHIITHNNFRRKEKVIKEKSKFNQSTLVIGFKSDKLTEFERKYVSNMYNFILGGGPDSRLFDIVREQNSLCYSISSSFSGVTNTMTITSGINKKDYSKALKLIKKIVKDISLGNFNDEEIEKGKITYLSTFKELEDSIYSILNLYISKEYLDLDLLDERKKEIVKVTKEDIINFSKKIHMDTIFLLEGESDAEEEIN